MSQYFNYKDDFRLTGTGYKGAQAGETPFETLQKTNPYANRTYNESPWQQFLGMMGFRTQADAFKENMQTQAAEYDAQIAMMQYQNEYNSPQNQVARMRAAGINPDIDGGKGIDSGNTDGLPQDPSTPMQTTGEEGTLGQVASGIMSIFSSAVGIVANFQGIKAKGLQNDILAIQKDKEAFGLSSSVSEFAKDSLEYLLPETPEPVVGEDGTASSWENEAMERARIFSKNLPRKFRDQFLNSVQSFWNSVGGSKQAYEAWQKRVQNRRGYSVDSRTNYSHVEEDLSIIADELGKLQSDLQKKQLQAGSSKAEAEQAAAELSKDIDSGTDPTLAAGAINAGNESTMQTQSIEADVNAAISKITDRLSKNDDIFSKLLLVLLYASKSGLVPKMSVNKNNNTFVKLPTQ